MRMLGKSPKPAVVGNLTPSSRREKLRNVRDFALVGAGVLVLLGAVADRVIQRDTEDHSTPVGRKPATYHIGQLDKDPANAGAVRAYSELSAMFAGTVPRFSLPAERREYGRHLQANISLLSQALRTEGRDGKTPISQYDLALQLIPAEGQQVLQDEGFEFVPVVQADTAIGNMHASSGSHGRAEPGGEFKIKVDNGTVIIPLAAGQ